MDREFWLDRWRANEIGFHNADVNPWLMRHWPSVGVADGASVFVPLCGKSLDMRWLNEQGHPVIGVELSSVAIAAYFSEGRENVPAERRENRPLVCYQGLATTIYCGDLFEITAPDLEEIRGVYDRAALVALPPDIRPRYVEHVLQIVPRGTRILLITVEYDQSLTSGPPFSVEQAEVERLYGVRCDVELLARKESPQVPPRFRASGTRLIESGYLLTLA